MIKTTISFATLGMLGVIIDETALVPIGSIAVIAGAALWVGRKLQKIDDRLYYVEKSIENLPCPGRNPCHSENKTQ